MNVSASGACASTSPHGSTIIERPPVRMPGAGSPTWLAAITKHWFSIARARSSTSQWSRVVVSVNAAGTVSTVAPRDREDARQLGEAQVVADRQAEAAAVGELGRDDLVAGRLVLGLAVGAPADLDVEHVDLAVDRAVLAVGADVDARVGAALRALDPLGDRAGDEVDAQLARGRARPARAPAPSSGSAPAAVCSGVPSTGHFSGSTTSSAPRAAAARVSRSAASRLRSRSGVELSCTAAARMTVLSSDAD